jgi:outer membrane protein assembly factor BamB
MGRTIFIFLAAIFLWGSCGRMPDKRTDPAPGGILPGTELLDSWPGKGPDLIWTFAGLGRGYGGPLITKEGIFVNAEENGKSYTVGLNRDGTLRWRSPNGDEFVGIDFTASYPGTRSAPSMMGRYVYAVSGTGHLSCYDARTGKVIWNVDLMEEFDGRLGDFGYSESPVVDEHKVYCFPGGYVHNMVALDRHTGALIWSSPVNKDHFSYGTPLILDLPDKKLVVGSSRNYIHVVNRQDGELLSSYRLEDIKYGYEHCNSVVHRDGYLYFVLCEEHGQGTIKLSLSPDGRSLDEVWRNEQVINVFEGFVVVDDLLYTTMENKKLLGLDTKDGSIRHSVRSVSGSIVHADNKLFIYGHNGRVQLFGLESGAPELNSEFRIREGSGHHFSFPVIADGVMYIRRGDALMAYAVK